MRLVDEYEIELCSGKGGDGIVSWLKLKFMPKGGPAGGDGGKGGDVYIKAVRDIEILRKYAGVKKLSAQDGGPGQRREKKGQNGEDLIFEVPVGSFVKVEGVGEYDLLEVGEEIKILAGGWGGLGNARFKSSTNQAPKECTPGKDGKCAKVKVELRVIADIGLVGRPNAGKSSLLNAISNSKAKVGNYEFTTLEPNLGVFNGFVVADIPGLVEGASLGKGLGIKFLKHIRRTKVLVHLVSVENSDVLSAYTAIRKELGDFDKSLLDKKELVVLSKSDLVSEEEAEEKLADLKRAGLNCSLLTVNDPGVLDKFKKDLLHFVQSA